MENKDSAIKQALLLMQRHITALNNRDAFAIANTLHFPHHRLSNTTWKTWDSPEQYWDDFLARAGNDWTRSEFSDIKVADASSEKVHLDAEILRYDSADRIITSFRSLWVIIKQDGRWGAKLRSSFAQL